jgi:acyl-CoA reductase-like NAD-dependent aldehyde dehydrogenase
VWSAEVIPTLDALRWLSRRGSRELTPRRLRPSRLQWYFRDTCHALHWEPHGVVGIVTPGNSLLFLALPQVAAALLAGNAVLWKPAPLGTALALYASALFHRVGLPPALLQIVPGGAEQAREMVEAGVDKLFFTGGSAAGLELYRVQAGHGRPAVLELSGRHVTVVLTDADLDLAARGIAWAKLDNRGRNCVSVQLVLAERPVAAAFLERVRRALDAADAGTMRTDPAERSRLVSLAADALERGARAIPGSASTILLADVARGMRVVEEEVQGPVLAVALIDSAAAAIDWINRGRYRLSASIWSGDVKSARRLARALDVGQVWINDQLHPVAQPEVTLAGRGASGFGAGRGHAGLMEMVQPKVISETRVRSPRRHYAPTPGTEEMFRATVAMGFARSVLRRGRAALALLHVLVRLGRTSGRG